MLIDVANAHQSACNDITKYGRRARNYRLAQQVFGGMLINYHKIEGQARDRAAFVWCALSGSGHLDLANICIKQPATPDDGIEKRKRVFKLSRTKSFETQL